MGGRLKISHKKPAHKIPRQNEFLTKGKIASRLFHFLEEKEHRIAMIEMQQKINWAI